MPFSLFPPPTIYPLLHRFFPLFYNHLPLCLPSSPPIFYHFLSSQTLLPISKTREEMATAFSASKFAAQPFPLNRISPISQNNPLTIPTTTSSFLGSTRKLIHLSSSSNLNLYCRYGTVVTISDVVKKKKSKSTPNLLITKEEGWNYTKIWY
ncbi:hypothetical protein ERO13_A12G191366v2 [Gossypium hirsutum]|nr:hypothetical protein ERO13_A12G191366v2 [Gossypium hirsutum]